MSDAPSVTPVDSSPSSAPPGGSRWKRMLLFVPIFAVAGAIFGKASRTEFSMDQVTLWSVLGFVALVLTGALIGVIRQWLFEQYGSYLRAALIMGFSLLASL